MVILIYKDILNSVNYNKITWFRQMLAHGQQKSWNPVSFSLWVYKMLSSLISLFLSFMRSHLCPSTFRRTCEVKLWKSMIVPSNRCLLTEWEDRTGKHLAWGHGVRTERRSFWPKSQDLYSNKVVSASRKEPYAILTGLDAFFQLCSRHRVRISYGDFLNSFAMKARARPYGSNDKPD